MPEISKKPVPKWLVIVAIVVAVFVIGAISRAFSGTSESVKATPSTAPAKSSAPSFAKNTVTEQSVRAAVSGIDLAEVEVQDNLGTEMPDDKIVHINYEPAGAAGLGEKPMLMDLTKVSADVFEKLFANPKIGAADVTAVVVMSSGGADQQTAGARIYWDREKADSVDFKTYRADVVDGYFWEAFSGAPDFYVHPGVLAGLSETDRAKLER